MNKPSPSDQLPEDNKITKMVRKIEVIVNDAIDKDKVSPTDLATAFLSLAYHFVKERASNNRNMIMVHLADIYDDWIEIVRNDINLTDSKN